MNTKFTKSISAFTQFICVATMVVCSSNVANAQVFSQLGTGTAFNDQYNYPAPYGNYWYGARHQLFVTAAELTAAGIPPGANILSIGFDVVSKNTSTNQHINWTMTVYTTTATDPLASGYINTGQVAISTPANPVPSLGWNQTSFPQFQWNGTENLVIETCFNNTSYQQNHSTYYTNSLSGPEVKSRWNNADNSVQCTSPGVSISTSTRPNMRFEWLGSPCVSTPATNTILPDGYSTCPGIPNPSLTLVSTYTNAGITFQWYSSTVSPVGPFTAIPGATLSAAPVPTIGTTTYFQVVVGCVNASTVAIPSTQYFVAGTTIDNVPYYEGFEGIQSADRLPNCSWFASNISTTVKTYKSPASNNRLPRTGNNFMTFGLPSSNNAVFTNGINMEPGVTYSAAIHYATEYMGATNWNDLSIWIGPNQNLTGMVQVANVGPVVSGNYKLLSGLFTVPSTGVYYMAMKASGATGNALYISIDDISITIPCEGPGAVNSPTVNMSASNTTICAGDQVNLTATGADAYLWSTGSTQQFLSETPMQTTLYQVIGTNTLTGCSQTLTETVYVNPAPTVFVTANTYSVCSGSPVVLSAVGSSGNSYVWSNNATGPNITVSPTQTGLFNISVIATNQFGCTGTVNQAITVAPLPNVSASTGNPGTSCASDMINLLASGANTYVWTNNVNGMTYQGANIFVNVYSSTTFTVVGTNTQGCSKKTTLFQEVEECVGLKNYNMNNMGLSVFPNPTNGKFTVEFAQAADRNLELVDLTGRVILNTNTDAATIDLSLEQVANGVYYLKVAGKDYTEVVRIIKN